MSQQEQESVLSRWSRRKLETQETAQQQETILESLDTAEDNAELQTVESHDEPVLTDADMPEIESLNESSDFSMFMSSGVSDKLRNLALRKMFHVPAFNIRDGLDEYDEDYTYFEKLGDIVTCDMKHQIEMQEKKKQEEAEAEAQALADEEINSDEITAEENSENIEEVVSDDVDIDTDSLETNTEINSEINKHA